MAGLLPHQCLRAATQADHDRIDAAFGRYDLTERMSYSAFLQAHSRILPPLEERLFQAEALPPFERRTPALIDDLARLGHSPSEPLEIPPFGSAAEAWGMFYVVEGSRLGGVMLARTIPADLPKAYLSAGHPRGNWRAILAGFDAEARSHDAAWMERAISAAGSAFAYYGAAA